MTLATNATLEERIKYGDPYTADEVIDALIELESWKQLGDTPSDVRENTEELEEEAKDLKEELRFLQNKFDALENEVETLKYNLAAFEEAES